MVGSRFLVGSPRRRIAISKLVFLVLMVVIVGIGAEFTLLPKASQQSGGGGAPTTTMTASGQTSGPPPSTPVKSAVNQFVQDFNTRNVAGLGNFYSQNAVVTWTGNAAGLAGTYNGAGNVRILYGSSIGKTTQLNATVSNYAEKSSNPSNVNVTLTLDMRGNSTVVGNLNATVAAAQNWVYNGGQWQISKETWNYKKFDVQFPVSATTFPQWGALRVGKSPDLVSEKSFEWHAGPYVAASVYAFLFGVVAIAAVRIRSRTRKH